MKLSELVAHVMELTTLNREPVLLSEIRKGESGIYFSDSKWSDIYINSFSRIYDAFNELNRAGKLGYGIKNIKKDSKVATIELAPDAIDTIGQIIAVYTLNENTGDFRYYSFRNLTRTKLVLNKCFATEVYVVYALNFPKFSFSEASNILDVDFTQTYGVTEQILNWVAKYATAEIQENIDTYKAYSDKNDVLNEIEGMPDQYTLPSADYVEDSYVF